MKVVIAVFRTLWKILFVLNFALGLILLYPFFAFYLSSEKRFFGAFRLMRFWAKWILFFPGIRVRSENEIDIKNLPQPCVFCANHSSYLDIVTCYYLIPDYFIFMGKQELAKAPLFNIFFKKMNILVNRKSNVDSHKAFTEAAAILDKGQNIFIFPEATISTAGELKAFKNGAFRLAIEKQVPIVAITFLNNWRLIQTGAFFKAHGQPGIAKAIIHKPIETKGMNLDDLLSLKTNVRQKMQDAKNKYDANR
ncbi:MAG: lysophospholipid acyltransferase family protein [Bacteroidia bacterium]